MLSVPHAGLVKAILTEGILRPMPSAAVSRNLTHAGPCDCLRQPACSDALYSCQTAHVLLDFDALLAWHLPG